MKVKINSKNFRVRPTSVVTANSYGPGRTMREAGKRMGRQSPPHFRNWPYRGACSAKSQNTSARPDWRVTGKISIGGGKTVPRQLAPAGRAFLRSDRKAAWRLLMPVLEDRAVAPPGDFPDYAAGTRGPRGYSESAGSRTRLKLAGQCEKKGKNS